MICYIFIAILNGVFIVLSRVINGQLGSSIGPLKASLWNHVVGFIFLTFIALLNNEFRFDCITHVPFLAFTGGILGMLFVTINSYVFPKIGATMAVLLVISGQMILGVLISHKNGAIIPIIGQLLGVISILIGIYLANSSSLYNKE